MKRLLILMILIATPAFADTYQRVDDKRVRITKTVPEKTEDETVNIQSLKEQKARLETLLADVDFKITEAAKVGVE